MRLQPGTAGAIARNLIGVAVVVAVFLFFGRTLVSNWSELRSEEIDVQPALLAVSLLPAVAGVLLMAFVWTHIVGRLSDHGRSELGSLPKVFLYSWAGRYVPGKVAYVLGRFVLGRAVGISAPVLVGSMVYENALLLVAGAAVATLTLVPSLAVESESVLPYLALPLLAAGGLVVLHPRVLGWALRFGARLLGRDAGDHEWLLPPAEIARVIVLYAVALVLSGTGFYLMITAITSYSVGYLPLAGGTYALAGVVGMISIFAPAGIGVREGIIVAVLQATMPVELAVVVSLVARVWATVVDLLLVAGCFAYDNLSGDRMLIAAMRGSTRDAVDT